LEVLKRMGYVGVVPDKCEDIYGFIVQVEEGLVGGVVLEGHSHLVQSVEVLPPLVAAVAKDGIDVAIGRGGYVECVISDGGFRDRERWAGSDCLGWSFVIVKEVE
jgi:hypothetical protein